MGITTYKPKNSSRPKVSDLKLNFRNESGQPEMTCIAKRGHIVSMYANFMLIEDWNLDVELPDEQVDDLDIETDMTYYYVNTLGVAQEEFKTKDKRDHQPRHRLFKCLMKLNNQIKPEAFEECKTTYKFDISLHTRIAPFFKLYTGLLNVSTFFLVSHRNYITLFDLKEGVNNPNNYCQTIPFTHKVVTVCNVNQKHAK